MDANQRGTREATIEVRRLSDAEVRRHIAALAEILVDCVDGGASVSFMAPLDPSAAEAFFAQVADRVESGDRVLLAAFVDCRIVGTVQVLTAMPPNQPHRAEIAKLLVHRAARGRGVAKALMNAAEAESRRARKTLLVLDTATGSDAERLYERLGWRRAGVIPGYALLPDGQPCSTTFFWKTLQALEE
jgi:GNAT superfamily N-acetyltransferase